MVASATSDQINIKYLDLSDVQGINSPVFGFLYKDNCLIFERKLTILREQNTPYINFLRFDLNMNY